ncbi:hypothetical protein ES695_06645 [Candidatus Atribacteria bacterium 1244-E10-H5-B2]|nr:MAG: hypothetical protein ES695_06645 [Candidatus Atribacteria bacterium 1244-E10-H5-B2]
MTENLKVDILGIIADDVTLVPYRPKLNKITGSVLSTIILQQILYWWKKGGRKRFYKFKDKCNHALYSEGDSWLEELCFTREEFDTAIKKIGFKMGKTENKIKKEKAFIIYYRDPQGVTWYDINAEYLTEKLTSLFLVKRESHVTKESGNPALVLNTETTAEKELAKEVNPPAKNKLLRKELEELNFSDQEIERLFKAYTPEQIKNRLKALKNRKNIRVPKVYFLKMLKADYPSKNTPVISDNGGNGDSSDDFYPRYIPKKDDRTPEKLKRDRLKIAELAGKEFRKLRGIRVST